MKNVNEVTRKSSVTEEMASKERIEIQRGFTMLGQFYVPALTADKTSPEAISEALSLMDVEESTIGGKTVNVLLILIINAATGEECWVPVHKLRAYKGRCELELTPLEQELSTLNTDLKLVMALAGREFKTVARDVHTVNSRSFFRLHEVK